MWRSLSIALLTLAIVGCTTCEGEGLATGGMLEGVYVCVARRCKGGDFEPWLTEEELMLGEYFFLDLPYHLFRRRGSN